FPTDLIVIRTSAAKIETAPAEVDIADARQDCPPGLFSRLGRPHLAGEALQARKDIRRGEWPGSQVLIPVNPALPKIGVFEQHHPPLLHSKGRAPRARI